MSTLSSVISSGINLYLLTYINTGNKVFDNLLLSLGMVLVSYIFVYFNDIYKLISKINNYLVNKYIYSNHDDLDNFNSIYYMADDYDKIIKYDYIVFRNLTLQALKINQIISHIINKKIILKSTLKGICLTKIESNYSHIDSSRVLIFNILYYDKITNEFIYYATYNSDIYLSFINIDVFNNFIKKLDKYELNKDELKNIYKIKNKNGEIVFETIGKISINKRLDNIYFQDNEKLLNILIKFKNKELYPKNVSIDNKLGIFLYGPPGTGKTGLISAVANYLNFDIVIINFAYNYKISEFEYLFTRNNYLNKIIVFDEIDYLIKKLSEKPNTIDNISLINSINEIKQTVNSDNKNDNDNNIRNKENNINKDICNDINITMEYLLSKLDGVEYSDNRIIMATTNYPDIFEERFLRPGRFDIKIEMGYATKEMIINLISNFFSIDKKILEKYNFIENKFSPLEIQNKCILLNDYSKVIEEFIE